MAAHKRECAIQHAEQFFNLAQTWPQALRTCEEKWNAPTIALPQSLLLGVHKEQEALRRQQLLRSAYCPFCYGGRHPECLGRRDCRLLSPPQAKPGSYDIFP